MAGVEHWLREAEAADRLADIVSLAPEKRRLRDEAEGLRVQARAATEEARAFGPTPEDVA